MAEASGSISNWWRDMLHVLIALWLVVSPWNLQLMDVVPATWNAEVTGALLLLLAVITLGRPHPLQEWGKIVLGAWLVISPYLLGYADQGALVTNHTILGLAAIAVAATGLQAYRARKESIVTAKRVGLPEY